MSGRTTELSLYVIPCACLLAVVMDLITGRIFNWLTVPLFFAGLVFSASTGGWSGLGTGFLAALAALGLFGALFAFHVMGGGDVKFLMALGAWTDPRYVLETAIVSILLGGVMAAFLLLVKGRLPGFARRIYHFLLTLFVRELELEAPALDRKLTMPFGVPIAVGAVWVLFGHPLHKLGVFPWL